jgi:hypothetical protein
MVGFPLLLIPVALYNAIAFLMPTVSFSDTLFSVTLVSGKDWPVTLSDVLLTLGVLLLLLEVIKGARPGAKYLTDHLLSLIVFGGAAFEFVMWPKFGSSTFFLLTLLAMTDFLTGIALRTRRHSVPVMAPAAHAPTMPRTEVADAEAEPSFDRAPVSPVAAALGTAPSVPAAASVAESVLMDHPEPKTAQPVPSPREPKGEAAAEARVEPAGEPRREPRVEPKIASPELQPGDGSQEQ